jgi:hypothetical protein
VVKLEAATERMVERSEWLEVVVGVGTCVRRRLNCRAGMSTEPSDETETHPLIGWAGPRAIKHALSWASACKHMQGDKYSQLAISAQPARKDVHAWTWVRGCSTPIKASRHTNEALACVTTCHRTVHGLAVDEVGKRVCLRL